MNINDLRSALKDERVILGKDRTLKMLRQHRIKKIFLASNAHPELKEDIHRYGKLLGVSIIDLELTNEEIGTLCKRPFLISVIGVQNEN